ncbi:hypothetical protein K3722_07570 [Leisingera caerulea]|uniref:Uncharacterized protein n=1 Tax=Leisingera caerulea TaxID=506591 RepID=A0ABY5X136_LEICA|nr:hypothetical protein [Leisingera caerulea]UWQ59980.1 hypothetical protein K3722_07570 [Leisingera caerulea]
MTYKVYFEPSNAIRGVKVGVSEFDTAQAALVEVEGLVASDERVRIVSSAEGEVDLAFLRKLAREESK